MVSVKEVKIDELKQMIEENKTGLMSTRLGYELDEGVDNFLGNTEFLDVAGRNDSIYGILKGGLFEPIYVFQGDGDATVNKGNMFESVKKSIPYKSGALIWKQMAEENDGQPALLYSGKSLFSTEYDIMMSKLRTKRLINGNELAPEDVKVLTYAWNLKN
jgi:hypothetical protein